VHGLGCIATGVGELIVAVLAQVADMERRRILERTALGREAAKAALASTGKTHKGKTTLGRPRAGDPSSVRKWRAENRASIARTAAHFSLSIATVKRYCACESSPSLLRAIYTGAPGRSS
jgi:putative DNA-invertase from lambdoid prophage Rac